jgi:hypothetical protein
MRERPLDAAVIWAPETVRQDQLEMAGELSVHFAAAFFIRAALAVHPKA